jgi:hypothetical protein
MVFTVLSDISITSRPLLSSTGTHHKPSICTGARCQNMQMVKIAASRQEVIAKLFVDNDGKVVFSAMPTAICKDASSPEVLFNDWYECRLMWNSKAGIEVTIV